MTSTDTPTTDQLTELDAAKEQRDAAAAERERIDREYREWEDGILYKTRFDGVLDEDALFGLAASLGSDAERLHTTCGGAAGDSWAASPLSREGSQEAYRRHRGGALRIRRACESP